MSEPTKDEVLALAARIDDLPAYSGRELKSRLYQSDLAESTASTDISVIMIDAKWRKVLADALRRS